VARISKELGLDVLQLKYKNKKMADRREVNTWKKQKHFYVVE